MHLATERLLLPPLGRQHAEALGAVYADEEVARYIGGEALNPAATVTQVEHFEAIWTANGYGQSAVVTRSSGEFVGRVGLHPWPEWDEVEIGWVLARHAQGQGYAKEAASAWLRHAFGDLALSRLTAVIHPDNQRSRSLAERLGFTLHRRDVTPAGVHVLIYERSAVADA